MGQTCPGRPRMVAWAVRPSAPLKDVDDPLDAMVQESRAKGYDPDDIQNFSRATPSGSMMNWRLAYNHYGPRPLPGEGIIPFLIDWSEGASPPMNTAPPGLLLQGVRAGHPEP